LNAAEAIHLPPTKYPEQSAIAMDHNNRLVLLAEDENDEYVGFLRAVNKQASDIQVMRLDNGYSLLNMLQTAIEPFAIFLDVNMPYKNGLNTLIEIREMERFKDVPIIMFSKSGYEANVDIAYEFGATYFIVKCVSEEKLSEVISRLFSSSYFKEGKQPPREEFFIEE
jgi:CheY-like chemotaxis protein